MSIPENILKIKSSLPNNVTLVAVSKTKPISDLQQAYDVGQRVFGENKIQEMTEKWAAMPIDVDWHMIGHVQTNKVKFMAPYVKLIHGVESLKLLQEIDKHAKKNNRKIDCLLQMFIAQEETKFGLNQAELHEILDSKIFQTLEHINVVGLMGMASFTKNERQVRAEFLSLKSIFDDIKLRKTDNLNPSILSMGMSGDYKIAIEMGSTMVRIGSNIFASN